MNSTQQPRNMNPSPYHLPQFVSDDRQRARSLTIALSRERYPLAHDPGISDDPEACLPIAAGPWPARAKLRRAAAKIVKILPPKEVNLSCLPPESQMTWPKFFRHATHMASLKLRVAYIRATSLDFKPKCREAYARIMGTIPPPRARYVRDQDADFEFARQRLAGVNPMAIQRCDAVPTEKVALATQQVLAKRFDMTLNDAIDSGRLFKTEYPMLWEKSVQEYVRRGASLAAPTCLFYVDDRKRLMPVAVQLKPQFVTENNPVFTPLLPRWDWRLACAHAQAADSHYHESISHLLETHLVCEVFALATHRNLHCDHPLHQLLMPHFEHTLAINEQAGLTLLAPKGQIAGCMAARHSGNINLVRMGWKDWDWESRELNRDLAGRGVEELPGYLYRDDSLLVHSAIDDYARGILKIWYSSDEDVRQDYELQAWAREIADPSAGRLLGFPSELVSRDQLIKIISNVIFRATAQHAAVNNGQFSAYGWVPNAPAAVYHDLPNRLPEEGSRLSESEYYAALPNRRETFAQTGLAWLLSEPTTGSILRAGGVEAFSRERCFDAFQVVGQFRRRMSAISFAIDERNLRIGFDYNFLKPKNIDHSISI